MACRWSSCGRLRNKHDDCREPFRLPVQPRVRVALRSAPREVLHRHSGREDHRLLAEAADVPGVGCRFAEHQLAALLELGLVVADDLGETRGGTEQYVLLPAAGVVGRQVLRSRVDGQPQRLRRRRGGGRGGRWNQWSARWARRRRLRRCRRRRTCRGRRLGWRAERAFDRVGVVAGTAAVSAPWPLRRTPRSEQSPPRRTACAHYRVPANCRSRLIKPRRIGGTPTSGDGYRKNQRNSSENPLSSAGVGLARHLPTYGSGTPVQGRLGGDEHGRPGHRAQPDWRIRSTCGRPRNRRSSAARTRRVHQRAPVPGFRRVEWDTFSESCAIWI